MDFTVFIFISSMTLRDTRTSALLCLQVAVTRRRTRVTWSGSGAPGPRPLAVRTVRRPPVQRRTARQRRTDTATQSGSDRFAEVTGAVAGSRQRLRLAQVARSQCRRDRRRRAGHGGVTFRVQHNSTQPGRTRTPGSLSSSRNLKRSLRFSSPCTSRGGGRG